MSDTTTLDIPTDDGAEFTYNGATYRVRVESDEDMSLMDDQGEGMWCGRLEWVDAHRNRETGQSRRPDGFDGRARILRPHHGDNVWWQVPADIPDDAIDAFGAGIVDILNYGYVSVGLARLETCDHGHVHVVDAAWLGGIEPFPDGDYVVEILRGHLDEMEGNR